ncbi:toxin-antitoxin system HicB family antitoxin [Terrabacter sp. NPDC080008]|uniref:type II toxin-antitoxin system HicB family antitoxin n=1 Tax=Terrabacter sp. NPDC080008 TaxID=3155176 RepID=UPI00344BE476
MDTLERPQVEAAHYAYLVSWSVDDQEYVATCLEFPSLSWLASTQVEALKGLEALIEDVLEDMRESGEEIPQPLSERSYSGRFNVRVGESLHRTLALQAARDGMSLNQYIVKRLAG